MDVETTVLPGIGMRYALKLQEGRHLAILAYPSGRRDVAVYSRRDPDASEALIQLSASEANAIAEFLGAPRIVEHLMDTHRELVGLRTGRIVIPPSSPYVNASLGSTHARTVTGSSVVAVVRGTDVHAAPGPDFVFAAGDVVVGIGTEGGIERLELLITTGVLGPPSDDA